MDPATLIPRLRRIEGQVHGLQRMLEAGRGCDEVLTQVLAARAALEQVSLLMTEQHIHDCVLSGAPDAPAAEARLAEITRVLRLWTRAGH